MSFNTYSFQDVIVAFNSPDVVGAATTTGAGVGSISVDMTTERTTQEVAADGTVMISKVLGENGTLSLVLQQVSELNRYLLGWYNYINDPNNAIASWADMVIDIKSPNLLNHIHCTGVSPQKLPTKPFGAQGASITWTFMCAQIVQDSIVS